MSNFTTTLSELRLSASAVPGPSSYFVRVCCSGPSSSSWGTDSNDVAASSSARQQSSKWFTGLDTAASSPSPPPATPPPPFNVTSSPLPGTAETLTAILQSRLVLQLVSRTPSADGVSQPSEATVSTASLPLSVLSSDLTSPSSSVVDFLDATTPSPSSKVASLTVQVTLSDSLSDASLGGAVFSFPALSFTDLPPDWIPDLPFDPAVHTTSRAYHDAARALAEHLSSSSDVVAPAGAPAPAPSYFVECGGGGPDSPSQWLLGPSPVDFGPCRWSYKALSDGPSIDVPITPEDVKARLPQDQQQPTPTDALPTTRKVPVPQGRWSLACKDKEGERHVFVPASGLDVVRSASGSGEEARLPLAITKVSRVAPDPAQQQAAAAQAPKDSKKAPAKGVASAASLPEQDVAPQEVKVRLSGHVHLDPVLQEGARQGSCTGQLRGGESSSGGLSCGAAMSVVTSRAVNEPVLEGLRVTLGMGDVVGMRQWKPKKKPRDVVGELKKELDAIVTELAADMGKFKSVDKFYEHIQTSGKFFEMKERLRGLVQLVAHSRFRSSPADDLALEAYRSELFTALSTQLNAVLVAKFTNAVVVNSDLFPTPAVSLEAEFKLLGLRAAEAEAAADMPAAMLRHEDRVALGKTAAASGGGDKDGYVMLAKAWDDMCVFCLKSGLPNSKDRALECAKQAAGVVAGMKTQLILLDALVMLDENMFEKSEAAFNRALTQAQAEGDASLTSTISAGLCILHSAIDEAEKKVYDDDRESLRIRGLPMLTFPKRDLERCVKAKASLVAASDAAVGAPPRRRGVAALLNVCEIMLSHNLFNAASRALAIAVDCERLAVEKEATRGLQAEGANSLYGLRARLDAAFALSQGRLEDALIFASDSKGFDSCGLNWETLGKVCTAFGDVVSAVEAYESAVEAYGQGVPLDTYLKLASLLMSQRTYEAYERAKEVAFRATKAFGSPMAWRLIGVCSFETGRKEDAEWALQESLRIDCFFAPTWAYLALVALDGPNCSDRVDDAVAAAKQALALALDDSDLLRQLGEALFMQKELELAEFMLRRSLVLSKSAVTRRVLGDLLHARNKNAQAVAEFTALLDDDDFTADEKQQIYHLCKDILTDMSRDDNKVKKNLAAFKANYERFASM